VQLAVGVGAGDMFEEGQQLLVPMPWLDYGGDLPGGYLQRSEQGRGAMPDVVVATPLDPPRLGRQDRRGPFQRLDLRGGSVENRTDSARHGWIPSRQAMTTVASEIPRCLANSQQPGRPMRHPHLAGDGATS
jgi:hypothetical protein